MTIPILAFFNNKGGVGKTSIVYHLAWMFADLGVRIVAADLDPQANLTASLLDESDLEAIFDNSVGKTVFHSLEPLKRGIGDIRLPHIERVADGLGLVVGDLKLSAFEDTLSEVWPKCNDRDERAFRVTSAFWRILQQAGVEHRANLILMDLGPNLGAINRAALIAADFIIVPLAPDLFSMQGLRNLGPTLSAWRGQWAERLDKNPMPDELCLPAGKMEIIGYIVLQHSVRLDRPVQAYDKWISKIPGEYGRVVLKQSTVESVATDPNCLALLKHYRSLVSMAQEARKPVFHLKAADGAIGSHYSAVKSAYDDFKKLAREIASRIVLHVPLEVGN